LDCFAGSGTTIIAAKELQRKYIGFEISEKYCKIIEKRLCQKNIFDFQPLGYLESTV
jgi:DNA modification methylase